MDSPPTSPNAANPQYAAEDYSARLKLELEAAIEPTEEELARQLTDVELKKLCLHFQPKVHMWKWNVVHDAAVQLEGEGRMQKRTPERRRRILERAVNTNQHAVYRDDEIQTEWKSQWRYRKKVSLWMLEELAEKESKEHAAASSSNRLQISDDISDDSMPCTQSLHAPQTPSSVTDESNASLQMTSPNASKLQPPPSVSLGNNPHLAYYLGVNSESITLHSQIPFSEELERGTQVIESQPHESPALLVLGSEPVLTGQRSILTPSLDGSFNADFCSIPMTCTSTQEYH